MPESKKRKTRTKRRQFKDLNDLIENATDHEFSIAHRRLEIQNELIAAGWMVQERIKLKGYFTIGTGSNTLYVKGVEIKTE